MLVEAGATWSKDACGATGSIAFVQLHRSSNRRKQLHRRTVKLHGAAETNLIRAGSSAQKTVGMIKELKVAFSPIVFGLLYLVFLR